MAIGQPFITDNSYDSFLRHPRTPPASPTPDSSDAIHQPWRTAPGDSLLDRLRGSTSSTSDTAEFDTKPDYRQAITGAGDYQLANEHVQGANLAAASNRGATVRSLLSRYGMVPDFQKLYGASGLGYLGSDVDATTRDLAQQNTAAGTSTIGQLQRGHQQSLASLRALLASRGILDSGQSSLLQSEQGRGYAKSIDSAQSSLFDALQQAQQNYLNTYSTGEQTMATAAGTAANRLQGSNAFDSQHVKATKDTSVNFNGSAVYKDAAGNYWSFDGGVGKPIPKSDLGQSSAPPPPPPPPPGPGVTRGIPGLNLPEN